MLYIISLGWAANLHARIDYCLFITNGVVPWGVEVGVGGGCPSWDSRFVHSLCSCIVGLWDAVLGYNDFIGATMTLRIYLQQGLSMEQVEARGPDAI